VVKTRKSSQLLAGVATEEQLPPQKETTRKKGKEAISFHISAVSQL